MPIGATITSTRIDSSVQLADFEAAVRNPAVAKEPIAETNIQTAYGIIDQAKTLEVLERCQADLRSNVLHAPRVTMWNGQSGMISDVFLRPFVTGLRQVNSSDGSSKSYEPQIRVLKEGSTLRMQNELQQNDVTEMLLSLNMSDITRVDTFSFSDENDKSMTIHQPVFVSQTMNVKAGVPNGSSIIMKSDLPDADNSDTILLFVATCLVMNTESTERLAAERDSQLKKIDEKIAAEKLRIAKLEEQKGLPDVFIRAAQPGERNDLDELAQALLKRAEIEVDLSGRLEYDIEDDRIQIRGDSISLGSEEQGCLLRADTGQIVLQTLDGLSGVQLLFQGNSIRWSTDPSVFEVSGDGRHVHPIVDGTPVELSAERFSWNAETNELKVIP